MTAPARTVAERIAESMLDSAGGTHDVHTWLAGLADRWWMSVDRADLGELAGWEVEPGTGNLRHHTGRFFTVEGLTVDLPGAPVPHWCQPIINQPEIGILGILVREIDGVLHCLMQAKHEPGNPNGLQISPTVQATRSNYTRVHRGREVPYLEYFRDTAAHRVLIDIRQSEQGAWFYRKRNRNIVVEVDHPVEVREGFRWLTLGQIAELMSVPDLVNMDARTVLACLPGGGGAALTGSATDEFTEALVRSADRGSRSVHELGDVLSWITQARTHTDLRVVRGPLAGLADWSYDDGRITHRGGGFFSVVGVRVQAGGREVGCWSQPMIEPATTGVIAFVVRRIDGVLHLLTHARTEPGYADVTELAPTVQCAPSDHDLLPARPRFLDAVLGAGHVHFDTVLAEEGGRFLGARNRYLVVEADVNVAPDDPRYRWLTLAQYEELLRHSFYVNIQARSLVLCLRSLIPRR